MMPPDLAVFSKLLRDRAAAIAAKATQPDPQGPVNDRTPEETRQLWRGILAATILRVADRLDSGALPGQADLSANVARMHRSGIGLAEALAGREALGRVVAEEISAAGLASLPGALDVMVAIGTVLNVGMGAYMSYTEEHLRTARRELIDAIGGMGVVVFVAGMDSRLVHVNEAGVRMLGASSASDLIGRPFADFYVNPDERAELRRRLESEGMLTGFKFRIRGLDGREFIAETNLRIVRGEDGRPSGIEGFARDASELAELERTLEDERLRLRGVVASLGAGLSLLDRELTVLWVNEPMTEWFGPAERIRGRKCYQVYHGRNEACPDCPAVRSIETGEGAVLDVPAQLGGDERVFRLTTTPVRDSSGRTIQVLELTQDVTEESREVEERRRTGELLAGILGSTGEYGVVATDESGGIRYFSEGAERMFGVAAAEAVDALRFDAFYPPEARAAAVDEMRELASVGRRETEIEMLRAGGVIFNARLSASTRMDKQGQLTGFTYVIRDVTQERAAQKMVTLLAHALASSREGVMLTDMSGVLTYVNPMLTAMTGRGADEMLGGDFSIIYPADVPGDEIRAIARATLAGGWSGEVECVRKDDSRFSAQLNTSLVRDDRGRAVAMVGLVRDITREKALQKRLYEQEQRHVAHLEGQVRERTAELERAYRELQKLDAMKDRFLTNISHELRTPLVSGVGYIELILQEGLGPINNDIRNGLRVAHRNMLRLVNLIDDLLAFTRLEAGRESMVISRFDLGQMVTDCLLDLKVRAAKTDLRVDMDIAKDLPQIEADEENIHRVFTNLLSNAEKFSGEKAHISVSARRVSESRAEVRISDNGIGIPQDELDRVFDRFYRSRNTVSTRYGGTGIGLSLVKEIITAHGCTVRAEARPEGGAAVIFTLPLAGAQPLSGGTDAGDGRQRPRRRQQAAILVIDDDPEIHELLRAVFSATGDRIVSAVDGSQAVALASSEDVDLVFLDIAMPGMSGMQVLRELRASEQCRQLPVYMLSARTEAITLTEARKLGATGFITKPFAISEVREAVNDVLAGSVPQLPD